MSQLEYLCVFFSFIGVALASASSGLGEITFLSLSSHYHK